MYIYNVTLKVAIDRADEWLQWMRSEHIPEVIATGFFTGHKLNRLLDDGDLEGITFVVQYDLATIDDFLAYKQKFAPELQRKHIEKFGDDVFAFRTLMEVIS